jgi:multidrug efflux pump subunit AcrA (membrane-fusion protein)
MGIPIGLLAALPWKKIGIGILGALVLAFLAAPWILWRGALKDLAVTEAELAVSERDRAQAIASAELAIDNRERIESALDTISAATSELADNTAELVDVAERAGIRAREVAAARAELAELRIADAELRRRAENLDYCETLELVVQSIAED